MLIPVEVLGVRIEMPSNQPFVLLKEIEGNRILPIWVGSQEATAIAFAQEGINPNRPLTHDLISHLLDHTGNVLTAVHITELRDGIFFPNLELRNDGGALEPLSARPSDAIAIALRVKANILVESDLMEKVGIEAPQGAGDESEVDLEAFREFLDQINPEDFA